LGGYSGNAGDSFSELNGQKFHTYDNDQGTCARDYKGMYIWLLLIWLLFAPIAVDLILISSKVYLFANELIDWLID